MAGGGFVGGSLPLSSNEVAVYLLVSRRWSGIVAELIHLHHADFHRPKLPIPHKTWRLLIASTKGRVCVARAMVARLSMGHLDCSVTEWSDVWFVPADGLAS